MIRARSAVRLASRSLVPEGKLPRGRRGEVGNAAHGGLGTTEHLGDGLEYLPGQRELARPVDL